MQENYMELIFQEFHLQEPDLKQYSPLTFAYLGDCVYEIAIRTIIVYQKNMAANQLHKKSSFLAKATTQSAIINSLLDELTAEEMTIYKRGRNAFSPTRAKNATMSDYRRATGFECLIGYLYMNKQYKRLTFLIKTGIERLGVDK